ncbi:MAG: MOSC domain-containing protein [Saonia sp.]
MIVNRIYSYPLKSGRAIMMENADIASTGILNDRTLVTIDENNRAITGREYPKLTAIVANYVGNVLQLSENGRNRIAVAMPKDEHCKVGFKLFRHNVEGLLMDSMASDWISTILGTSCRLVWIKDNFRRVDIGRGGEIGDFVGYADVSPIHLISEESLNHLNSILDKNVTPLHFRPNIVVKGGSAFEEDHWKKVLINGCEFKVHYTCKRCIFTTIDPMTSTKDEDMEPLATLANFRNDRNEPLTFGIYLVPRKSGSIQVGNEVTIAR